MLTIEQITEIAQDTEGNSYLKNVSAKQGYVYDYTLKDNCPDEIKNVINMIINQPKQDDYLLDFEFRLSMLELGI